MQYTFIYVNKVPVISFIREDGSLLGTDLNVFGDEIMEMLDENVYKVAFDLRKHSYLNSFGLGELINLRNYFLDKGVICILIVTSPRIIKLFEMVGIAELFETAGSEKEI